MLQAERELVQTHLNYSAILTSLYTLQHARATLTQVSATGPTSVLVHTNIVICLAEVL